MRRFPPAHPGLKAARDGEEELPDPPPDVGRQAARQDRRQSPSGLTKYCYVYTIRSYMQCGWNQEKAERNYRVHGISFETAAEIFRDPYHIVTENYFIVEEGEQRYQAIGMSGGLVLLLVVFVERGGPDEETIHIISARKATDYEKSAYEDQFRR
jgi:hypothetical protein